MTDIILIQPPGWAVVNPPLGLAMLKAYLQGHGLSCKIMDLNIAVFNAREKKYRDAWNLAYGYFLWNDKAFVDQFFVDHNKIIEVFVRQVIMDNPAFIGFSVHGSSYLSTRNLSDAFHQYAPEIPQVFGGPQMALGRLEWKEILISENDVVIFGEGEESLVEVMKGGSNVPGTATWERNNGLRPQIRDLNSLPFPDFSDFTIKNYYQPDYLPTYFSRGCLNKCAYCTESVYFPGFRCRSGERVFEEILHQRALHSSNISKFRFHDSVSNGNIKELERLCDLLIENDTRILFNMDGAVIRKEMTTPLLKKLRKAGCNVIGYGMETPSHSLLANIGKTTSRDADIQKIVMDSVGSGITIGLNFMFGLPGETEEDSLAQIELITQIPWYRRRRIIINPSLTLCAISPGSRAYTEPDKYGIDLSAGEYRWQSTDGENTFEIRKDRFNRFVREANNLRYGNLFDVKAFPGVS